MWRFLRSRSVAALSIFLLVLLCVVGTVVPQRGESSYGEWQRDNPRLAPFVHYLGLDKIFTSVPFVALVAVVFLSTLACALSRLPGLKGSRAQGGLAAFLLSRHRLAGSLVFHVGILVTFAGAALSALTRAQSNVTVIEGQVVPIAVPGPRRRAPRPGGASRPELFRLRLDKFHPIHSTRWSPSDYASDVTVLDSGREGTKTTVRVNRPLKYDGITLYQQEHGFAPRFMFAERKARRLFNSYIALNTDLESTPVRYLGSFAVPGTDFVVKAEFFPEAVLEGDMLSTVSPVPRNPAASVTVWRGGEVVFSGPIFRARPVEIEEGVALGLGAPKYWSEFTVVKDSGVWLVFLGSWIAVAGLCVRYFPRTLRRREQREE